jgi:outer membrane protein W
VKKLLALAALVLACPSLVDARPRKKPKKTKKAKKDKEPTPQPDAEPEIEMDPEPAPAAADPAPTVPPASSITEAPPPADATVEAKVDVSVAKSASSKSRVRRLYVRAGVAVIKPLSQSRELELADVDGAASLAVQNGPIAGSGAEVGGATIPAIILGYKLPFWGDRFSVETVLGLPFEVKLKATGTLRDESLAPMALGIPTGVPPLGEDLGTAKAAPPTVTLVYNLYNKGRVQPYVGAGAAILFAFDEKVTNQMLTEVSQPEMSIAPAPGLVLQGGIEAQLFSRVYARLDVKFIALMMARAEVKHVQVRTPELPLFDTVEVGTARMNVWVNPVIVQAGIGTDF